MRPHHSLSEGEQMHRHTKWFAILTALTLFASACSSSQADPTTTVPAATTAAPATTEAPSTTAAEASTTTEAAVDPALTDVGFEPQEGEVALLRYLGDVRVSRDDGETWFYGDTGLWLEAGDRVQVSDAGIAIILFPDDTRIRLEGFADFQLIRAEFDFEAGTKQIVGRLWEGAALVSTLPLPNAESLFQLWSMTTFIDLPYDPDHAIEMSAMATLPEDQRIVFGAVMREDIDGELLINYPDSVLPMFYAIESIDGEVVLIATEPSAEDIFEYRLPFRDSIQIELDLERILDIVATLVDQERSAASPTEVDFFGYSMLEQGELAEGQTLYAVFENIDRQEYLLEDAADRQDFVSFVRSSPQVIRHRWIPYRYFKRIPDIFSPEILMQLAEYNMGCDITTGLGCGIPDGCDTETGEGCTFVSGCNIITRDGCKRAYLSCIAYANCYLRDCNKGRPIITHFCKPKVRTYCDPTIPGDCERYLVDTAIGEPPGEDEPPQRQDGTEIWGDVLFSFYLPSSIPVSLVEDAARVGEPVMNANDPATCQPFVNLEFWNETVERAGGGFTEGDFDDDDIEWCTCRASVPPGWPPPPPWKDMTYRCFCDESIRYGD
jgi:hypothetical protein